ncbi:MAG TPA: uroporphyrinogen decarboxylase family protein [Thermoanaerobaculia bacterium]|nr:uroporphyrinogen decarboxylase family protein [Thermoanaerobaculia bacterium]
MPSERFQNALRGVPQRIPPIWLMRQAGRYHRHYQELRRKHSFVDLCRVPELAAEAARGPVEDFDFDVAILFSDLLFPLEALGLSLTYDDSGPKLDPHLDAAQLAKLRQTDDAVPHLEFQREAMRLTRAAIPQSKSVIGFVGGPWTLYVYAVEGSHQGSLRNAKCDLDLYRRFTERMAPLLIENIRLQLDGGAEVVMILDTAAGEVAPDGFRRVVLPDILRIASAFPGRTAYYSRGSQPAHLRDPRLAESPLGGVGVDWRWSMTEALEMFAGRGIVQGNFDPALLFLPPDEFANELRRYLEPILQLAPEQRRGWICGLGHGVLPRTPEENVRSFVSIVREMFA